MTLWVLSSRFLIPEPPLLVVLPVQHSDRGTISVSEVHELLTKIHDIPDSAVSKVVGNTRSYFSISFYFCFQAVFWGLGFAVSLSPTLRTLFHLVRHASIVTLIGLCLRLSNNQQLACPSLQPLWDMEKLGLKQGSILIYRRAQSFLCSLLFCLGYPLIFPSLNPILPRTLFPETVLQIKWICLYLCPLIKTLRYDTWLLPCYRLHLLQSIRSCPFWVRSTFFFANSHAQLCHLHCVIESDMLNDYHSMAHLICSFDLSLWAQCQLWSSSQLHHHTVPLRFPLNDVIITTDATCKHWLSV